MQNEAPGLSHASRNSPADEETRILALRMQSDADTLSHDSRNSPYRRARDAKATGASCGHCGRAIGRDEPVWATRLRVAPGQWLSTLVCEGCAPEHARGPEPFISSWGQRLALYEREPCEVCGRPVEWLYRPHWQRYWCCSERCSGRRYNRARDEASAHAREKVCEVCGAQFTATRSDARTCSQACRQRAYRRRSRAS